MFDYGLDVQEALDLPRLFPSERQGARSERGIPPPVPDRLARLGHDGASRRAAARRRPGDLDRPRARLPDRRLRPAQGRLRAGVLRGTVRMTEPCDLTAVEARRLIGREALSPVELLESCIARIEAVDHAVNAMVARDFDRARAAARAAEAAVMRGEDAAAAARPAGRHQGPGGDGGAAHHLRQPALPRPRARARTSASVAEPARGRRHRAGQDQHARNWAPAPIRATPSMAPPATRSTRRTPPPAPRAARRWRWRPAWCRLHRLGHRRQPAQPGRVLRRRRLPAVAGPGAERDARGLGWSPLPVLGPMARTVGDACLLLSAMASDDRARSAGDHGAWRAGAPPRAFYPAARRSTSSGLRVAITPDFGFAPTERHVARGVRRQGAGRSATSSPAPRTRRPTAPAPTRPSRCCAPSASSPRIPEKVRSPPDRRRPQRPRQCRGGAAPTPPADVARARGGADRAVPPLAGLLRATST